MLIEGDLKMKTESNISMNVIRRLPKYHRLLGTLQEEGISKVSSKDISDITGFTASQIRQDFNTFGGFGKQGYGYDVESLKEQIGKILGLDNFHKAIIVGAGHLGQAIANHSGFRSHFLDIQGIFDIDKEKFGLDVSGMKVKDENEMEDFIKKNNIEIAILCTPKNVAVDLTERLISFGIAGIWNFAPIQLQFDESEVVIENVNLTESLYVLSYLINEEE